MKILQINPQELKPAEYTEYNPRQMTKKQLQLRFRYLDLKKNIKEFGLVDPILVNSNEKRKNIIIDGHQRVKIAIELRIPTVPVVYIDLNEKKERELNLRLNKNIGEWDMEWS